jgi:hypothetical protein
LFELLAYPAYRRNAAAAECGNIDGALAAFVHLNDPLSYRHWDGFHAFLYTLKITPCNAISYTETL